MTNGVGLPETERDASNDGSLRLTCLVVLANLAVWLYLGLYESAASFASERVRSISHTLGNPKSGQPKEEVWQQSRQNDRTSSSPLSLSDSREDHRGNGTRVISCDPTGTSCVDPIGVAGEWVRVGSNRTFEAPTCCRGEYEEFLRNNRTCGTQSADKEHYAGLPHHPQQMFQNGCTCDEFDDVYEWRSPNLVQYFDAAETCRLLGERTVLLVGDSTMAQTATTLMNSLLPGGCQTRVVFGMSDTLVGRNMGNFNRGKVWREWVEEVEPDIAIVTVGAHVREDDAAYLNLIDEVIRGMVEMRSTTHPHLKFAWKTQQPGGCTAEIWSPANVTHAAVAFEFPEEHRNWDTFYHRDLMLLDRLARAGIPSLDVRMLYSRSDAHISSLTGGKDCLHLCSPGPLDVIGRLFHQLLLNDEWSQ